jgi:hypothetical protein
MALKTPCLTDAIVQIFRIGPATRGASGISDMHLRTFFYRQLENVDNDGQGLFFDILHPLEKSYNVDSDR